MEDIDILNKFDNDKLIDVVKIISVMAMMMNSVIMPSTYWKREVGAEKIYSSSAI